MKVNVGFVTARLNGKLLFVEVIQDAYTSVQISLNVEELDEESIKVFRKDKYVIETDYNTFYLGEFEAKDICGVYGSVIITTESRTIDFE
jgi:hypothetical protein